MNEQTSESHHTPWFDRLPHDFHSLPFQFSAQPSLKLKLAEAIDLCARTAIASIITAVSIPAGYSSDKIGVTVKKQNEEHSGAIGTSLFDLTPSKTEFTVTPVKPPSSIKSGIFERVSHPSTYPISGEHYRQHHQNESVVAYHWRHGDQLRPTVIFVHGFMAAQWFANDRMQGMTHFYNEGYDVFLLTLPHHGERTSPSNRVPGLDYVSGGIEHMNHAVVQSSFDIRSAVDYLLEERNAPAVGITGVSLGGYTCALMAGLEKRLSFVMPMIPIISIPDAMMEWTPLNFALKRIMTDLNIDMHELRRMVAFHSPLAHKPLLEKERLMILAGAGDRMASPRHAEALQTHWNNCETHWFEGSHVVQYNRGQIIRKKLQFLKNIGFV